MSVSIDLYINHYLIIDNDFQGITLLWDEGYQDNRVISIPKYLDQHSSRLKKRYLKFIYDLGEKKISEKKISEYFKGRNS